MGLEEFFLIYKSKMFYTPFLTIPAFHRSIIPVRSAQKDL